MPSSPDIFHSATQKAWNTDSETTILGLPDLSISSSFIQAEQNFLSRLVTVSVTNFCLYLLIIKYYLSFPQLSHPIKTRKL